MSISPLLVLICNLLVGLVVPIPTKSSVFARTTLVPVLFQEVELDKLLEPPSSVPQLKTPFASVSTVLQFARFENETLPDTFKVPDMFTFPITTSFSDGDKVPMPTLLLTESTNNVPESTVKLAGKVTLAFPSKTRFPPASTCSLLLSVVFRNMLPVFEFKYKSAAAILPTSKKKTKSSNKLHASAAILFLLFFLIFYRYPYFFDNHQNFICSAYL